MGLHTALPIYKVTYDLALLAATLTRNIPRSHKAHLGRRRGLAVNHQLTKAYRNANQV